MIVYPRKPSRKYRNEADVYTPRLWAWVKKQKGSDVPRNFNDALAGGSASLSPIQLADPIGLIQPLSGSFQ